MMKLKEGECGCVLKRRRQRAKLKQNYLKEGGAARENPFQSKHENRRSLKEDSVCRIRRRSLAFPVTPEDFRQSSSASYPILKQGIPSIHVNHIEGDTQTFPEIYDISVWNHKDRGPNDINSLTSKFDDLAGSPLFSAWNIAETKKVSKNKLSNMEETTQASPDIIQFIKERDAARDEMKKAQDELAASQSKLYDALQRIEALEKKLKSDETAKPKQQKKTDTKKSTTVKKTTSTTQNGGLKVGTANKSQSRSNSALSTVITTQSDGIYHPPIANTEPTSNSVDYYWKIAEQFQSLPMFQVLDAEKKFIKADVDNSGTIDKEELDKVLTDTVTMFTPKQVDEIFAELDQDQSNAVDFYEVLVILNKLSARRRTNLPHVVTQNYSKTCTIQ